MKSLSLKSTSSSKKSSFKFSDCFDTNASISSILYSRCLLYVVLLISLINLFYFINFQHMYSLIIFFLVGFVASFFVKNMIIVILFATFVSLFFQSTLRYGDAATEGMETKEEGEKKKNDKTDDKTDDKDEGFKFSYQGEEPDLKSDANDKLADKVKEVMKDKVKDVIKDKVKDQGKDQDKDQDKDKTEKKIISGSNAEQLKKDMKDYFAVQEQLLDVLAKAEPLQQEAMQIKERFSKNKGLN